MLSVKWWHDRLYANQPKRPAVHDLVQAVERHMTPELAILDIGAGAGELNPYSFRGRCRRMVGVDFNERITENPLLDEGVILTGPTLPFDDDTFDLIFSIYVLEHIEKPEEFAAEVYRVLKPGGRFISLTPNQWHYVPLIARFTPMWFHTWVNKGRGLAEDDVFPTYYRLNTRRAQRRHFGDAGFNNPRFTMIEVEPAYLKFNVVPYLCGVLYERITNATSLLAGLRVNILSEFMKPGGRDAGAPHDDGRSTAQS